MIYKLDMGACVRLLILAYLEYLQTHFSFIHIPRHRNDIYCTPTQICLMVISSRRADHTHLCFSVPRERHQGRQVLIRLARIIRQRDRRRKRDVIWILGMVSRSAVIVDGGESTHPTVHFGEISLTPHIVCLSCCTS